jgi:hypothetical protein
MHVNHAWKNMKNMKNIISRLRDRVFGEPPIVYEDKEKVNQIKITISASVYNGKRRFFYEIQESDYGALSYDFDSPEALIAKVTSRNHKKFLLNAVKNNLK